MEDTEQAAIVSIALMAAAADGSQSAQEQAQLQSVAARGVKVDLDAVRKQVSGGLNLADVAARLTSDAARHRAYEAALVVCNADGPANPAEERFLSALQAALGLAPSALQPLEHGTRALATAATSAPPTVATSERLPADATLDDVILKQAMLTGALEILPDSLASLAILPVQLRLVYLVGQQYGQQLDANQVKDLAGTLGIGAAAQLVEGVVRKVLGGLTSGVLGGLLGGPPDWPPARPFPLPPPTPSVTWPNSITPRDGVSARRTSGRCLSAFKARPRGFCRRCRAKFKASPALSTSKTSSSSFVFGDGGGLPAGARPNAGTAPERSGAELAQGAHDLV